MPFSNYNPLERTVSSEAKLYDVFLSFRGEDTRKTIVDHLHASFENARLRIFLDSLSIHKGEEISSTILKGIERSAICVPIFSENYAESHWCLEELAHMCKCDGIVIPLFYYVEPVHVRRPESGVYSEALKKQRSRYGDSKVNEWKRALAKAASFSGWSMATTLGYEAELVKLVVQDVLRTLQNKEVEGGEREEEEEEEEEKPNKQPLDPSNGDNLPERISFSFKPEPPNISNYALAEQMNSVIDLLKIDSEDGRITVAICGMAGVGKTFLAKAVYNRIYPRFDAACFVWDVRHKAQHANGIPKMQRQMLKDLTNFKGKVCDESHGRSLMGDRLRSIKALVILEYVDNVQQLDDLLGEWFGPGSRIIITTLDIELVNHGKVDSFYVMHGLDSHQALQKFSWHAFLRDSPKEGYKELSKKAVNVCKGLPLLMEVLGAHLYNRDQREWDNTISILENSNDHDKYAVLRHCYCCLNDRQKDMFLDMACLFIGRKREGVISFWEANYSDISADLNYMKVKSLITDDENRCAMHSELRDMGRAIVEMESEEPGGRSRLWKLEDAELVLNNGEGTEKVRCLTYIQQEISLQTKSFQNLINLQLLWLDGALIEGDFSKMPQQLKWLRWDNCPLNCLPPEWRMNDLAVLDLSFSKQIETVFMAPMVKKGLLKLKVLKLNDCPNLRVLPDLAKLPSLVRLELCGCTGLRELPDTIGGLTELRHLDLSNCYNLTSLPEGIIGLSCLEVLFLSNCHEIRELPESFGEFSALKKIRLDGTRLQKLPTNFRWLSNLRKLTLHGCSELRTLPHSIGELDVLQHLDLYGCYRLRTLPETLYECKNLHYLDLTECKWINLEDSLGKLVNLENLTAAMCPYIQSLPASISNLKYLWHLNLSDCISLFELPEELGYLTNLEELLLNRCHNLCKLPESIGNLSKLKILEMEDTYSLQNFPLNFYKLASLEYLKSGGCEFVEQIMEFSSLEFLCIKSYKYFNLPECLGKLSRLTKLYLHHCTKLEVLPCLPNNLIEVCIEECLGLRSIHNISHMGKLKRLRIQNCRKLDDLPDFTSFHALQELSISGCAISKRIVSLEGLNSLRKVQVANCGSILRPRHLIKETPYLEVISFSSNGIPGSLQHKVKCNGVTLLDVVLEVNEPCTGIILCVLARF